MNSVIMSILFVQMSTFDCFFLNGETVQEKLPVFTFPYIHIW